MAMACVIAVLATASSGCALMQRGKGAEYLGQAKQMWRRGVAALESGRPDEAESWLRRATQAAPDDPDARRHLAEALWQTGQHGEALACAEEACRQAPTDAASAVRAGQMRLAAGDAGRAAQWADLAIGHDTRSSRAWALRGRAHRALGDADRALADLQHALRYAPTDSELLTDVAMLHRERGDHRRCLSTLHHLIDAHPPGAEPAAALALVGDSYLALGRGRDAADAFRVAADRVPEDPELRFRLAEAEAACGETKRAIAEAQRAIGIDAQHGPSRALLAELHAGDATMLR